ncbi:MAG: hypothetical protein JHC26_11675 [Thermofilum sp.]|uniref:hypothetical protein n=1 Tax=Thermofilum sp. TaxID=1961369 RepID=UPI00258896C5|nr:hypothetical protein [Thermofilum sp.]MCI4409742.1 hypothetical protein [Thermofilum sp.]
MGALELAKQMVIRTKSAVKEEERKQVLIEKFEEIFGFKPDVLVWSDGVLNAVYRVCVDDLDDRELEEFDWTVEGKSVIEVAFRVKEVGRDGKYDQDWKFSRAKGEGVDFYRWMKRFGGYIALVEITTAKN